MEKDIRIRARNGWFHKIQPIRMVNTQPRQFLKYYHQILAVSFNQSPLNKYGEGFLGREGGSSLGWVQSSRGIKKSKKQSRRMLKTCVFVLFNAHTHPCTCARTHTHVRSIKRWMGNWQTNSFSSGSKTVLCQRPQDQDQHLNKQAGTLVKNKSPFSIMCDMFSITLYLYLVNGRIAQCPAMTRQFKLYASPIKILTKHLKDT